MTAAVVALALTTPAAALASGRDVVRDCVDNGRIDGKYSQGEYGDALSSIPADVDQYTECRDVILRARSASSSSRKNGRGDSTDSVGTAGAPDPGGPGDNAPGQAGAADIDRTAGPSPEESAAIEDAIRRAGGAVSIGGQMVKPGASGLAGASADNGLPAALLAVLVLLGLGALAAAAIALRAGRGPAALGPVGDRMSGAFDGLRRRALDVFSRGQA